MTQTKTTLAAMTLAGFALFATGASACGPDSACPVEGGEYRVALPDGPPKGAVMFIHGYGGSAAGVLRNSGMINAILERGYMLVAPNGLTMEGRNGGNWSFHPERYQRRDEVAFIQTVKDDVIERFGITQEDTLLSGFSIGGSMASYVACQTPDAFHAYAPVGGSFWRPHPTTCEGDVRLFHTHGWNDGTVPLEGRVIRGGDINDIGAFAQGDVFHAMDIWRQSNECIHAKADRMKTEGAYWIRGWDRCQPGSSLEFALFPGGHVIPAGWSDMVLDWFESL